MRNNQHVPIEIRRLYIIIGPDLYLLRPSIVAIFRKVFFEGILHGSLKQDGHNSWPKHVGGCTYYNIKDLHICAATWLVISHRKSSVRGH